MPQLSAIAPVAQRIDSILQPIRQPVTKQGEPFKSILIQVRDLLLIGGQLPPEWQQFQTNLEQQRQQARQRIAQQLEQVQRILLPGQNQLIDWQPPLDILAADTRRLAQEQMRVLAEMHTVADVLERLRFLQLTNIERYHRIRVAELNKLLERYGVPLRFLQLTNIERYHRIRVAELNKLLERYGVPQDSPAYPRFRSFGIEIFNEIRGTPWKNGKEARILLAVRFLRELDVINGTPAGPALQAPLTWQDMFTALTSPQAPLLIQQMITARASGQLPQQPIPLGGQTQQPQGNNN